MLLIHLENQELAVARLGELPKAVGGRLPGPIKEAIEGIGSALRHLRSAVAESLPGVSALAERSPPDEVDVADLWPDLSQRVATTRPLMSARDRLPRIVPTEQSLAPMTTTRELTALTGFLARNPGASCSATPAPRH